MSLPELSLNDAAVYDLDNGAVVVPDPSMIASPVVEVTNHQTEVDHADALSKELENYDATLTAVENGIQDHFKLNDVVETVLAAETISQLDAERVAAVLPEFSEAVGSPKEFSQQPSKTNLTQTQRWVGVKITASDTAAKAALKHFVETDLVRLKTAIDQLGSTLVPNLIAKYKAIREVAASDLVKAANSKAFFFGSDDEKDVRDYKFVNFTQYMEGDRWKKAQTHFLPVGVCATLNDSTRSPDLNRLVKSSQSGGYGSPAVRFYDRLHHPDEGVANFNYITLLSFLASQNLDEAIEDIVVGLKQVVTEFTEADHAALRTEGADYVLKEDMDNVTALRKLVDYATKAYASFRAAEEFVTIAAIVVGKLGTKLQRQ